MQRQQYCQYSQWRTGEQHRRLHDHLRRHSGRSRRINRAAILVASFGGYTGSSHGVRVVVFRSDSNLLDIDANPTTNAD